MAKGTPTQTETETETETETKTEARAEEKIAQRELTWTIPEIAQVIDNDGNVINEELEPALPEEDLPKMYKFMITARTFDERALALQRQGRLQGTYAPHAGQEGAQVGSGWALRPEDWMFPSYREGTVQVLRGQSWADLLRYWGGNEDGNRVPEGINNFTICIPIATQVLHAVGAAWAAKLKGDEVATLVYFGDGATSEGDFHEGMNFAGVFQTPTVFFCQNNQYAISVPRQRQTHSQTIAQKAIAYGFDGVQVDGNDALACYQATHEALERARSGGGPTLIEAVTYRLSHHTTADDWTRYRTEEEVEQWKQKDPISRFRKYLENKDLWDADQEEQAWEEAQEEVAHAVEEFESTPARDVEEIFKYTHAEMPWTLKEQLEDLREYLKELESE